MIILYCVTLVRGVSNNKEYVLKIVHFQILSVEFSNFSHGCHKNGKRVIGVGRLCCQQC